MSNRYLPPNNRKGRESQLAIAMNKRSIKKSAIDAAHLHDDFSPGLAGVVLSWLEDIFDAVRSIEASACAWQKENRAIRLPEVLSIMGISKSALYDRLNPKSASYDELMPRPFKLGNFARSPSVWWHVDVHAYLKSRADQQRNN